MTISAFTRAEAKRLRPLFEKALAESEPLQALAKELGVAIHFGNARFDERKITFNLEAEIIGGVARIVVEIAAMRGFDATQPSKEINGKRYRIVDHKGGSKPWHMKEVGQEASPRYWTAPDAWCLANFPAVISDDKSGPSLTEGVVIAPEGAL